MPKDGIIFPSPDHERGCKSKEKEDSKMKKIFALLLAAVMLLTMVGCGSSTEPVGTAPVATEPATQATEAPTEVPTESAYVGLAEELLQSEDTVTESYSDLLEYEKKLHELGFVELYFGTEYCKPKNFTYNDAAFCLVFSYYNDNARKQDEWVMYGIKSDAKKNITKYSDESLKSCISYYADNLMSNAPDGIKQSPIAPQLSNVRVMNDYENPTFTLDLYTLYYPTSNNLYNCYRENGDMSYGYVPGIIQPWYWVLEDYYTTLNLPKFSFYVNKLVDKENKNLVPSFNENTTLSNIYCVFEPGMTLKDWVDSPYNFEGWTWFTKDSVSGMISPSYSGSYVVLAEYHDDGSLYTIDEYLTSAYAPGVPILTYEDYCLLLDK